ncbi:hypothetical protein BH24CHL1_BH24CHL1_13090 [soil metagenome]
MRFWQRRHENGEQGAEQAPVEPQRAETWAALFPGDSSLRAYQSRFQAHTPLSWELVESGQGNLLRMLVNRVPADIGVPVVLGLSVLYRAHSKADQASESLLATMTREVEPGRARTMLVCLATAWQAAEGTAFDGRTARIQSEMLRTLRRLSTADLSPTERDALRFLREQLEDAV